MSNRGNSVIGGIPVAQLEQEECNDLELVVPVKLWEYSVLEHNNHVVAAEGKFLHLKAKAADPWKRPASQILAD